MRTQRLRGVSDLSNVTRPLGGGSGIHYQVPGQSPFPHTQMPSMISLYYFMSREFGKHRSKKYSTHILVWLQANSSPSLDLSFLLCTMGGRSLRAFPAQTAGALRASCSIALISLLRDAFLEGAPSWVAASPWKTFSASPARHLRPQTAP